jgi:serine/threonine protein kinase
MTENYKRIREIGKGGMSTVYLAREIDSNRLVALKVLKKAIILDKDYIKRFFREARITAQLDHPNIIRVMESNFSEGDFYIVTQFVDGGDFSKLLVPSTSFTLVKVNLKQKLKILNKVILALDYAHQKGIVHRDIKPSNILLTKDLEPKLCDFGIATALWGQESRYTRTNEIMGTMDYIAPEQKENSKTVNLRADIYSIGVILYQLITGRKPQGAFPPPKQVCPDIPIELSDIVMKCLQPFPLDRYKSAGNLSLDLEKVLQEGESLNRELLKRESEPVLVENHEDVTTISDRAVESFTTMVEKLAKGTLSEKLNTRTQFLNYVAHNHKDELLKLLIDPDTGGFLKETLIMALEKLKLKEVCPYLIELLTDPYYNKLAAQAIGEIGCNEIEAEEKLFKILLSHNEKSYIALIPLGKLNSVKSVGLIAEYLKDKHAWVREMALEALGMIKDNKVKGYLESAANKDVDANIRAKSKKILWRLKK